MNEYRPHYGYILHATECIELLLNKFIKHAIAFLQRLNVTPIIKCHMLIFLAVIAMFNGGCNYPQTWTARRETDA